MQTVSLAVQNRLLAALLKHWGLARPNIIGHDFGEPPYCARISSTAASTRRFLLIDPVALRPWGSPFVQHVRRFGEAFANLPDYIHRAILRAYIRGAAHKPLTDEALEPYIEPWVGTVGQAAFYRQIAQMDQRYTDEIQNSYGRLRCSCLLLWGINDQWIPIEKGRELARLIPGCQLVEIADCGHLMQEDAPEAILAAALRFSVDAPERVSLVVTLAIDARMGQVRPFVFRDGRSGVPPRADTLGWLGCSSAYYLHNPSNRRLAVRV